MIEELPPVCPLTHSELIITLGYEVLSLFKIRDLRLRILFMAPHKQL